MAQVGLSFSVSIIRNLSSHVENVLPPIEIHNSVRSYVSNM